MVLGANSATDQPAVWDFSSPEDVKRAQAAFEKWRPTYHIISTGWMNDPCGPVFNPASKEYHVAFQWNPHGNDWGNISWGRAASKDLVAWDVSTQPSLVPDQEYDREGIFTGCCQATGNDGESGLTAVYTSVNALPIHHTIPYKRGCETLSVATSDDGGVSWSKIEQNPILGGPPEGIDATSWRDPFISTWKSMSRALHLPEDQKFGVISGGIRDKTPIAWLYSVSGDLRKWELVGPIMEVGRHFHPPGASFDYGLNFEVTNFLSLSDESGRDQEDFLVMSCEGLKADTNLSLSSGKRPRRVSAWMAVTTQASELADGTLRPKVSWKYGGCLDTGAFYAASSFWDPSVKRHVVLGWVVEDDLSDRLRHMQQWSGCLSLPRVLYLLKIPNVHGTTEELSSISSISAEPQEDGTWTVTTLGIDPHPNLSKLRQLSKETNLERTSAPRVLSNSPETSGLLARADSKQYELELLFHIAPGCARIALVLGHSKDFARQSLIEFNILEGKLSIDRSKTTDDDGVNRELEVAEHRLFNVRDSSGNIGREDLHVRILQDASVLEVFANNRTVLTTRIYSDIHEGTGFNVFAAGDESNSAACFAEYEGTLWDGISSHAGGDNV